MAAAASLRTQPHKVGEWLAGYSYWAVVVGSAMKSDKKDAE